LVYLPFLCLQIILTFDERDELLAFLDALNGKLPDNIGPHPEFVTPAKTTASAK
jgi:hypothetical protein